MSELDVESLRVPPHSEDAERSVLGGLMLNNDAWINIADRVSEHDFYRKENRLIFSAIKHLAEEGHPCDIITVSEVLEKKGSLETAGNLEYIVDIVNNSLGSANITTYADIIRDRSILRQLANVGTQITENAFEPQGRQTSDILDESERLVFAIAEQRTKKGDGFTSIKDILVPTLDRIDELYHNQDTITGIASGFKDFDGMTSGLQRSDLIIVAGRPAMGKTSFSMNIAEYVAINRDLPVAVFSMEMPCEQLAMRLISSLSRVNQQHVRTGQLDDEDWPGITSAISILSEAKLFIDDTPALSPIEVRARARRLTREAGQLGLIVIDYLQLMQVGGNKNENRSSEISEISRSLKALAKELHVPVIALSQLNRGLEQRPNKRPVMSDLRESGAIEQDADLIVFIYRDEIYNESSDAKGTAEIIIAKQRNGPTGTSRLAFLGHLTRFENYNPENSNYDSPI